MDNGKPKVPSKIPVAVNGKAPAETTRKKLEDRIKALQSTIEQLREELAAETERADEAERNPTIQITTDQWLIFFDSDDDMGLPITGCTHSDDAWG